MYAGAGAGPLAVDAPPYVVSYHLRNRVLAWARVAMCRGKTSSVQISIGRGSPWRGPGEGAA